MMKVFQTQLLAELCQIFQVMESFQSSVDSMEQNRSTVVLNGAKIVRQDNMGKWHNVKTQLTFSILPIIQIQMPPIIKSEFITHIDFLFGDNNWKHSKIRGMISQQNLTVWVMAVI